MKIKAVKIKSFFLNEFFLKKLIVFMGILYWLYGIMPIIDTLFNLVSFLAIILLLRILLLTKQKNANFFITILILCSGVGTLFVSGFKTVTIIGLLYATIETMLMTYCDSRKRADTLYMEMVDIAKMFVGLGTIILVVCLLTYFGGYEEVYYYPEITTTTLHLGKDVTTGAMIGILSNANITSDFCVIYIGLVLFLNDYKASKLNLLFLLVGIISLFYTYSRGGYIGAVVLFLIYFGIKIISKAKKRKNLVLVMALILLAFIVVLMLPVFGLDIGILDFNFTNRTSKQMSSSTDARIQLWKIGIHVVTKELPVFLFGVGVEIKDAISPYGYSALAGLYNNMHNIYVQTLVGMGSIGCALFLYLVFKMVIKSIKFIFNKLEENKKIVALLSICMALMIINLVESDMYMKKAFEGTVFWLCIGYTYAISGRTKSIRSING